MTEPTDLPKELREFIDSVRWTFAKTMPEWPHEYIVRERVDQNSFVQFVLHIGRTDTMANSTGGVLPTSTTAD
jgi:hypothetical protein